MSIQKDTEHYESIFKSYPILITEDDIEEAVVSKCILDEFLRLQVNKDNKIVDFGCGRGIVLYGLEKRGYMNLFGIDLCNVIEPGLLKSTQFMQGDLLKGEFKAGFFDGVISTQTIEHCDERLFVDKVSGILKPQGTALISSVLKGRFAWFPYRNKKGEWVIEPTHLKEYRSVEEYKKVFVEQFEVLDFATARCYFSVFGYCFRILYKITRLPFFVEAPVKSGFIKNLFRLRIPILGYHTIAVLLKKRV